MFEKFGEFNSAEEINKKARELKEVGDLDGIKILARENGIDEEIAELYATEDVLDNLCDDMAAGIGKIEVEAKELKPVEIMEDWAKYIEVQCLTDHNFARCVRTKKKSLKGCIAKLLKWSWDNSYDINKEIIKAAGIHAQTVKEGIPGMGTARRLIKEYYTE